MIGSERGQNGAEISANPLGFVFVLLEPLTIFGIAWDIKPVQPIEDRSVVSVQRPFVLGPELKFLPRWLPHCHCEP